MFALPDYPRTLHVGDSGGGASKHHCPFSEIEGVHLVVEEKVDGSHCGLGFDNAAELRVFSRNTLLESPPQRPEFRPLHALAYQHLDALWDILGDRYVLYGEWALMTHSVFYDALPSYFLEDDLFDRSTGHFLSTQRRRVLLSPLPADFASPVQVLFEGAVHREAQLTDLLGPSHYKSSSWRQRCASPEAVEDSDLMEGLYIKLEAQGVVQRRLKWVRPEFVQHVQGAGHWRSGDGMRNLRVE